jgi:hypothetical protein
MLSGLLMLLPLPIPLTNTLPALTVVLLAAGAIERDGLFFGSTRNFGEEVEVNGEPYRLAG